MTGTDTAPPLADATEQDGDTTTEPAPDPSAPPEPSEPAAPGSELLLRHDVPGSLSERIALAEASYQSNVVPAHLRSVAGQLNAQAAAIALRLPLWTVQQNMHLIEGRVGWDATFIRAMVRRAGHKIRVTERTTERAEVTIWRSDEPEDPYVAEFTYEDAVDAELLVIDRATGKPKRDNWRRYMKAMLVARATTIAVREACPEVMLGNAYTPEELGAQVDDEGQLVRFQSERIPSRATEVTGKGEAVRAQWRQDIEQCPDMVSLDGLYAAAKAQNLLDRPLYDDGTTVEGALANRMAVLRLEASGEQDREIHEADVVAVDEHQTQGGCTSCTGQGCGDCPDVGEPEPEPVPDDPALCRMTAARRGVLAALADGGDVEALVQVEYGLPVEQVATRRLRELVTAVRKGGHQ